MPTTAPNSATYLVNRRRRIFVPVGLASAAASVTGGAASVLPWGVSGWREILIRPKLARRDGLVSCRSAGGSLDHLIGATEHRGRHVEAKRCRGFEVYDEFKLRRLLDGQIACLRATENLVDQA